MASLKVGLGLDAHQKDGSIKEGPNSLPLGSMILKN
ncbi:hypothetical protein OIU76_026814 [Salix suchowensis]|nr:hypothetical protein OIU76_026814 [Salix suchowensis]